MNIIEFYKKLSKILESCREKSISYSDAEFQLKILIEEADKSKLDIKISENILDMDNLVKYYDEMSFEEEYDDSYEDSYEDSSY